MRRDRLEVGVLGAADQRQAVGLREVADEVRMEFGATQGALDHHLGLRVRPMEPAATQRTTATAARTPRRRPADLHRSRRGFGGGRRKARGVAAAALALGLDPGGRLPVVVRFAAFLRVPTSDQLSGRRSADATRRAGGPEQPADCRRSLLRVVVFGRLLGIWIGRGRRRGVFDVLQHRREQQP